MTETPYIQRNPGDPITAEDWNAMQVEVKNHIANCIAAVKDEIRKTGVERADNSDRFATRSDTEWEQRLDERYAGRSHEHEGPSVYRRYIKRFSNQEGMREVFLEHGIGRFPLVDLYQLDPVTQKSEFEHCKLLFYYGHEDRDAFGLDVAYGRTEHQLGLRFEAVLQELGLAYDGDDAIADVVDGMWRTFAADPNDEIDHCQTEWMNECCRENKTVDELKRAGQWEDFYVAIKPRKCETTCGSASAAPPEARERVERYERVDEGKESEYDAERAAEEERRATAVREHEDPEAKEGYPYPPQRAVRDLVEVTHVNYDTLHLAIPGASGPLDLMILLRA
jgi:hypothetical protein